MDVAAGVCRTTAAMPALWPFHFRSIWNSVSKRWSDESTGIDDEERVSDWMKTCLSILVNWWLNRDSSNHDQLYPSILAKMVDTRKPKVSNNHLKDSLEKCARIQFGCTFFSSFISFHGHMVEWMLSVYKLSSGLHSNIYIMIIIISSEKFIKKISITNLPNSPNGCVRILIWKVWCA